MTTGNLSYQSWITPLFRQREDESAAETGLAVVEIAGQRGQINIRVQGLTSWRDCPEAGSCYRVWLVADTRLGPSFVSLGMLKADKNGLGTAEYDLNPEDVGGTGRSIEEFTHLLVTVQSPDDLWPGTEQVVTGNIKPGRLEVEQGPNTVKRKEDSVSGPVEKIEDGAVATEDNRLVETEVREEKPGQEGEADNRFMFLDEEPVEMDEFEQFEPFAPPLAGHKWWKIPETGEY